MKNAFIRISSIYKRNIYRSVYYRLISQKDMYFILRIYP